MENNPLIFKFIKTAEKLNDTHPLYDVSVEETIAKLGFPFSMAHAYRIAMKKNMSPEDKEIYIAELRDHQNLVIKEQEELQRRFIEHLKQQEEIELKKEKDSEVAQIESSNIEDISNN